ADWPDEHAEAMTIRRGPPWEQVLESRLQFRSRQDIEASFASSACSAGSSKPLGLTRSNSARSFLRHVGGLVASMAILPPTRSTVISDLSTLGAEMSRGWMRSWGITMMSRSGFTRVEMAQKISHGL